MTIRPLGLSAVIAFSALGWVQASAQSIELQKLTASPPTRSDYFAARVSLDAHVAVLGSPNADFDLPALTSGEAHVFRYGGTSWTAEQVLHAADRNRAVNFGMSVAVNGAVAVVAGYENGACADKPACVRGAAWVFRYDYVARTWLQEQQLVPADATTISLYDWQNQLGPYVSVSGDVIVLGLHFDQTRGPNTGAAYVYRHDGRSWQPEQKLTHQWAAAGSWFGIEVAVHGDLIVVGAFLDSPDLFLRPRVNAAGSAHVFRYDGRRWNPEQMLTAYFDGREGDLFGVSLSIDGDLILVGAVDADDRGNDSGAAYVFRFNETYGFWFQEQKLTASDGAALAEFGRSVSLRGGVAIVAAFRDNTFGFRSGAVYVFRRLGNQWVQQEKITASDELPADRFGRSISLSGDIALISAYRKDDACPSDPECDSGAAYIFSIGRKQP